MLLGLLASADLGVLKLSLMGGWSVPRGGMDLREAYVTMLLLAPSRVWGGGGGGGGSLWAVSKVESWMRAPHLPKFILLVNFSDTICGFDFRHF